MQVGANTTFKQIYDQMKPGPLTNESKHLRLDGTKLYTHNSLMPHGKGAAALVARDAKYEGVAATIKQTITKEHGAGVADAVFANLNLATGPGSGVKLSDLRSIKAEVDRLTVVDPGRYRDVSSHDMLDAAVSGADPALTTAFEKYAAKKYTSESFDFLRAVHDYRAAPSAEKARQIVDTFFDGGRREVNTSDRDGPEVFEEARHALMASPADRQAFDKVFESVSDLFAGDIVPKYKADQAQGRV